MRFLGRSALLCLLLPAMSWAVDAGPAMVGFRGDGTGVYAAKGLPSTWDIAAGTNVVWSAPLPERALSEPIVIAGKVLVSCEPELLVCYDAVSGKELWRASSSVLDGAPADKQAKARETIAKVIAIWKSGADLPNDKADPALRSELDALKKDFAIDPLRNWLFGWQGYAYNTPFSDGKSVWVRYGTGMVACYDIDGKRTWMRSTPSKCGLNIQSSQMQVIRGKVVFVESIRPDKKTKTPEMYKLTGLDAKTGEEVWHSKPFPPGDHSAAGGLTTVQVGGSAYLVTSGGQVIDPDSGEIVGEKFGNWGYCLTVCAAGGAIYFGPQRVRLKLDAGKVVSDDPLPTGKTAERVIAYDGLVYLAKPESLTAFDPAQPLGEPKTWKGLSYGLPKDAEKGFRVMPIAADGMLFCPAAGKRLVVVKPGLKPEIVASNVFPDPITAAPFAIDGRLFVRTTTTLYCLGRK